MTRSTRLGSLWPPLVPLVLAAALAEALVRAGAVPSYLMPTPSAVVATSVLSAADLAAASLSTFSCAVAGLALSFAAGTSLAVAFSLAPFLRRALFPYAVFFQTVPVIAVAPLLVIWFGFGAPTVIASAFLVSIFPVIASTMLGLQSVDPNLLDLFRLNGARPAQVVRLLRIPAAVPHILGGLRIAAGLAVIGAIVGEFIGGGGLGSVIDAARTQQRVDLVFAAVLASALLGFALVQTLDWARARLLRRWI